MSREKEERKRPRGLAIVMTAHEHSVTTHVEPGPEAAPDKPLAGSEEEGGREKSDPARPGAYPDK